METLAAHPNLLYLGLVSLVSAGILVIFLFNKILRRVN
ncbi:Uncharacterised protein [Sphingobacterium mizutaii]|uniref:Uncharacterized protein n=1 Tax=Sphingobacterium mizutaii TaxID=1010 RepID=A0AAJ4XA82_9SPHI|nr:hypothetical protein SAMN05192578_10871 [Sphingobacterium mizutaii]SNV42491.1 Uncharacterised protein [Sphingobacterium mizutaii]